MKKYNCSDYAMYKALSAAKLKEEDIRDCEACFEDGLYKFAFLTDFQRCECMLDGRTMELVGLNAEPAGFEHYPRYRLCS